MKEEQLGEFPTGPGGDGVAKVPLTAAGKHNRLSRLERVGREAKGR